MNIQEASNQQEWDSFLQAQQYSPFLQSWTMGEVYRQTGETPIRIELRENGAIVGICQCIIVPARRGRHVASLYGPVVENPDHIPLFIEELKRIAHEHQCTFLRLSPFWHTEDVRAKTLEQASVNAPHHLLGEHVWHIPLREENAWKIESSSEQRTEESIQKQMRKTTRNLIRRAGKEGVTIERSSNPSEDMKHFFVLHDETRKRHKFVPYKDEFFQAQVDHFAPRNECTVYLAWYQEQVIAASVHMHFGGETSYHHGASTHAFSKIPASYLLQWTAIQDALQRGDNIYSFWGIAPEGVKKHPFAGVTTFKKGFGGELFELQHCRDIPLSWQYQKTRIIEHARKWKRGF